MHGTIINAVIMLSVKMGCNTLRHLFEVWKFLSSKSIRNKLHQKKQPIIQPYKFPTLNNKFWWQWKSWGSILALSFAAQMLYLCSNSSVCYLLLFVTTTETPALCNQKSLLWDCHSHLILTLYHFHKALGVVRPCKLSLFSAVL